MSARKNAARRDSEAKARTSAAASVPPGWRLIRYYSHDARECRCAPVEACGGVPTIRVARGEGVDRCLGCGTEWALKHYRDDHRATPKGRRAGWLDDYLRPEEVIA